MIILGLSMITVSALALTVAAYHYGRMKAFDEMQQTVLRIYEEELGK